jgi:hypothetical protein
MTARTAKYVRSAAAVLAGTPGLPSADRADDEAKRSATSISMR